MKTRAQQRFVLLMALLLAGTGAWSWRENEWSRATAKARDVAVQKTAMLASQQRDFETRLANTRCEAEELKKALAQLSAATKAREKLASATSARTSSAVRVNGRWVRAIRSDPTVQALQVAASQWRLEAQFAPLCRMLGLTPEQREKFYSNLMVRETRIADVQAATDAQDIADTDDTAGRLVAEISREFDAAQRELLGEENYRRYAEFIMKSMGREMVTGLAKVCTAVGVSLSQQQTEALVPMLHGGTLSPQGDVSTDIEHWDWARMDAAVRTVLTDEQFALFRTTEPSTRSSLTRFSMPLNQLIDRAREADAIASGTKRPGG
jgi:hypothetical protein